MKKICLFLILLVTIAGASFAADTAGSSPATTPPVTASQPADDTARFDNERTILLVRTTQGGYPAHFMEQRLRQPFRLPYWDRQYAAETISPKDITEDTMQRLAASYKADVVLVPVVRTWIWRQYHAYRGWYDDDEFFTECWYDLRVYAYNVKDQTLKSYSSRGSERDEASILNDPNEILGRAMDQILEKLPYKRIPTDIER